MDKFKICPVCGMHNKPNMIECLGCETDLTGVNVTDEEIEKNKIQTKEDVKQKKTRSEEYIRICECGMINSATTKRCLKCGEDISDIAPILKEINQNCTFMLESMDRECTFEIKEGETIIGREYEIKDYLGRKPYVSRKHAKLIKELDKIFIENLSETNYTFVNNQRIEERTELRTDDEIGLGGNQVNGNRQEEAAYFILRRSECI